MPGKCAHGLTTRECLVCMSPKFGAPAERANPQGGLNSAELLATLRHIAAIAHSGGAAGLDQFDALCAVRRLTLRYWDSKQTQEAEYLAVVDAVRASECRQCLPHPPATTGEG